MAKESVFLPLKKVRGRMSSEGENNAEWKQVTSGQSLPVDDEKIVQQNEGVYCEVEKKNEGFLWWFATFASGESSAHPRDAKTESGH